MKQFDQFATDLQQLVADADAASRPCVYLDARGKVLGMSHELRLALDYSVEDDFDCTTLSFRDIDAQATLLSWRSLTKILRTTETHHFRTQILTETLALREGEIVATTTPAGDEIIYQFELVFSAAPEAAYPAGSPAHEDPDERSGPGRDTSPEPAPPITDNAPDSAQPAAREAIGLLWLTQFGVVRYADDAYLEQTGYEREDLLDIEIDRLVELRDLVLNWPDLLGALGEQQPHARIPYVAYLSAEGESRPGHLRLEYKMRTAARRSEYIELRLYEGPAPDLHPVDSRIDVPEADSETADDERLLLNEVLYRYTIQNSAVGVYWIRENSHRFLYFNDAFARITGYDRDMLTSLRREEIFPHLDSGRRDEIWTKLRQQQSLGMRALVRHRDGRLITVQVNATLGIYRGKALATVMVSDLSEQIELERNMQMSQFSLNASSFGILWVRMSDWSVRFSNEALRRMLGYPVDHAAALDLRDFMQPADFERLPRLAAKLREKGSLQVEGIYRRRDGTEFPVRRTANLIEQNGKAFVALYVEDITRERQLQHHDQLIRYATDRTELGVCFVRASDHATVYANKAFGDLLGYTLEEVFRLNAADYLVAPGPDQWDTTWKILYDTGRLNTEGTYRHRNGTEFPVFLRANYFEYEGEQITTVYVEDRRALRAAQTQLGLNQAAADDATLGIYYVQQEGNRIVYANRKIAELLGYELDHFQTLTPHDFLLYPAPDTWDGAWQALRENRQVDFEGTYKHRDGSVIPVKLHATYLEHEGRNLVSIYVEDQRTLRSVQEQLNLNQAAVDQSRLGIYYVSPEDFSLHFANARVADMLGYPLDEFRALNLLDFLDISSEAELRKAFAHIHREGHIVVNRHYRHRDGSLLPVRLNISKVQHGDHELAAVFVEDRRDFVATQEELKLQQLAVDQSQLGIYFCQRENFDIIYANRALGELLGYSADELRTLHPSDILVEPAEIDWSGVWETIRAQTQVSFPATYRHKSGFLIPTMLHCNYIEVGDRSVVACYITDLRELRNAEQDLRIHEMAVERASVGIFTADVNDLRHFYRFNASFAANLGYTAAALRKVAMTDVIVEPPPPEWPSYIDTFKREKTASVPLKLRTMTGELRSGFAQVTYFEVDGRELLSVIFEDTTVADERERALNEALDENIRLREQLTSENILLREEIDQYFSLENIITQSKKYQRVLKQVEQVADTDSTVLITGETGTGKELIANALHQYSKRQARVMTKVNCAALPESLIESELFGHERGAFTGADARKIGRFELADGGTLFLDEVGEMPLELQPKLLRVLQEGEFQRVGSTKTLKVDVRVVAATNRNLKQMVKAGTFREDLYYRLHVFPIDNLPLRERREDIPLLVQFFVDRYARQMGRDVDGINQESVDRLSDYEFPGNVRELENMVERSLVLHDGGALRLLLPD